MADIVWDTESKEELNGKEGHIRDNSMYLGAGLTSAMERTWGGILAYVKTSTDVMTGEVTVAKATEGEEGAVAVRRYGTQNAGMFNFWRPLRKLSLKVPEDRQFNVAPFTKDLTNVGTVFVFPMNKRVSVPRNLKEEQEGEEQQQAPAKKGKATAAAAKESAAPAQSAPAAEAAAAKQPEKPETPEV